MCVCCFAGSHVVADLMGMGDQHFVVAHVVQIQCCVLTVFVEVGKSERSMGARLVVELCAGCGKKLGVGLQGSRD